MIWYGASTYQQTDSDSQNQGGDPPVALLSFPFSGSNDEMEICFSLWKDSDEYGYWYYYYDSWWMVWAGNETVWFGMAKVKASNMCKPHANSHTGKIKVYWLESP